MGYVDEYRPLVASLVKSRGSLGTDTKGDAVPALTGDDMIAMLAVYTRGLVHAIEVRAVIAPSKNVNADGLILLPFGAGDVSAKDYLALPPTKIAWRRQHTETAQVFGSTFTADFGTYEPGRYSSIGRNDQLEQITALREAIDEFQEALSQITTFAATFGVLGSSASSLFAGSAYRDACSAFLRSLRVLGTSLDVLREIPPTTFQQDVNGALKAAGGATQEAIEKGSELAGELAAKVANEAGKLGGNILEGFFASANFLTIAVLGVLVYKYV